MNDPEEGSQGMSPTLVRNGSWILEKIFLEFPAQESLKRVGQKGWVPRDSEENQ